MVMSPIPIDPARQLVLMLGEDVAFPIKGEVHKGRYKVLSISLKFSIMHIPKNGPVTALGNVKIDLYLIDFWNAASQAVLQCIYK